MEKRNTVQREIVYNAVCKLGCHATADEIYAAVSNEYPSVSRGTVYRNLNVLSEEGKVKRVEVPRGADHFDHNCSDHYHVQCIECGKVFDVEMNGMPDIMGKIINGHGMRITEVNLTFRGICSSCEKQ